ncbi:hypothetical protein NQ314_000315 [Rhamnusium bicolor]|uniref:Uncharacterized protein n=1 Tax=Rhamnusium bicolor TaxID=1586634 RepID=A0AAV8ZXQ3_9CUCU|nr:hypothetical protein NQ314_000315 [Rhamnusium bicolor]
MEGTKDKKNQKNEARSAESSKRNIAENYYNEDDKKARKVYWITRAIAEDYGREEILRTTLNGAIVYAIFVVIVTIYAMQYVENHLIGSFFWESTYGDENHLPEIDDNAMNILYENKVLGVPRIRQVKVTNDSCVIHTYFRRLFLTCFGVYSDSAEDKTSFGPKIGTPLILEFPTSGGVIPSSTFNSVRLIQFDEPYAWFILVCEYVMYVFVLFYLAEELREIMYFKLLYFTKFWTYVDWTIIICAMDILGFSIMFFIIFFAFSELGYLLFGSQVENFSSFGIAMFTLLRTILGDFDYNEIEQASRILAPIYFLSYIFLNMFLAIINDTYADVKTEIAIAPDEMQMTEYLERGFRNFLQKWGCGGGTKAEKKRELNLTIRQIREALKKCGFSDLEIEMFFARYNIDPLAEVGEYDAEKLLAELEAILSEDEDRKGYVHISDFVKQQERLQQIDKTIGKLAEQVKTLLLKLEKMDNVKKVKKG